MFYKDYLSSVICTPKIKNYILENPSSEASVVLLLNFYQNGYYGRGSSTAARYTLDNKDVIVSRNATGKLHIRFSNE